MKPIVLSTLPKPIEDAINKYADDRRISRAAAIKSILYDALVSKKAPYKLPSYPLNPWTDRDVAFNPPTTSDLLSNPIVGSTGTDLPLPGNPEPVEYGQLTPMPKLKSTMQTISDANLDVFSRIYPPGDESQLSKITTK